jgi:hypothetical protein
MDSGQIIVVTCSNPREKFWGVLLELNTVGLTLRGIPVDSFEDWLRQWAGGEAGLLGAVTLFVPLHRIERAELDETAGAAEGLADRFRRVTSEDPLKVLLTTTQERDRQR